MTSEDDGRGGRSIGDVAGELRALRRTVRNTDDIARESAGLLSEIAPKVIDLEGHVATLRGTVAALVADAENTPAEDPALTAAKAAVGLTPDPPGPWCWPLLDRDQAAKAWELLARFVGELLVPTYGITRETLHDCWPRHPAIVAELTWLRETYREAHLTGTPAVRAADWHLRYLPGALAAIRAAYPVDNTSHHPATLCGAARYLQRLNADEADRERYDETRAHPATFVHWGPAWRQVRDADLAGRRPAPDGGSSS